MFSFAKCSLGLNDEIKIMTVEFRKFDISYKNAFIFYMSNDVERLFA